ncbi:MAG TPA: MFS transporter, partial [Kiloniellales bacterium]|nr:MFS transporter [Kiloniellales bacterium]
MPIPEPEKAANVTRARTNWTGVAFGLGLAGFAAYQQFKLPPVLPVLLEAYGYNRTLAGGFMSVYALAGLVLSIWIGRLLARRGIVGAALGALGSMILGNAISLAWPESGWIVLAGRALEGVGFAVLAISGPLIANANAVSTHLPLIAGLTASWIPLGQLSAILLAEAAFTWADWRLLWVAAIAGSGLLGLWTLRLARDPGVVLTLGPRPPAAAPSGRSIASPDRSVRRSLQLAGAVFMLWSGQYFAYMTWLPLYLVEVFGLSAAGAVVGYTVPVVVLIATNLSVGWILRLGVPVGRLLVFG